MPDAPSTAESSSRAAHQLVVGCRAESTATCLLSSAHCLLSCFVWHRSRTSQTPFPPHSSSSLAPQLAHLDRCALAVAQLDSSSCELVVATSLIASHATVYCRPVLLVPCKQLYWGWVGDFMHTGQQPGTCSSVCRPTGTAGEVQATSVFLPPPPSHRTASSHPAMSCPHMCLPSGVCRELGQEPLQRWDLCEWQAARRCYARHCGPLE